MPDQPEPPVTVTVKDPVDGVSQTQDLDPNSYVLVCGENMVVHSAHHYRNGTVQLTIKRRDTTSR